MSTRIYLAGWSGISNNISVLHIGIEIDKIALITGVFAHRFIILSFILSMVIYVVH